MLEVQPFLETRAVLEFMANAKWQHSISGFTVHGSAARLKPIFASELDQAA